jgi:hypothetical protein
MTDPSRLHVRSPSVPRRHSAHKHSGGRTVPAQSRPVRSLRQSATQDLGEYDRVIVFGVPRRIHEGEVPSVCGRSCRGRNLRGQPPSAAISTDTIPAVVGLLDARFA